MLITILIGTVQFGRFVKRLLVASKEEREKDQNNPDNLVRDVRSAIRTLIRMEGSKVGKINSSGTDGTTIVFNKDDKQHCLEIGGRNATVVGGSGKHDHGSSRVKLKNIVDYKWEQKNYPGRLIACHNEGKLIAYAITVNHRAAPEGMIRIVHLSLGQRALIKGMSGEVLDLQFAHISSQVILGIIEKVALHVHKVDIVSEKVVCTLLLKISDPIDTHIPICDKISWCPYLSDNGYVDEYASQLLVWTRGGTCQCYSVSSVVRHHGSGEVVGKDISEGGFKFRETLPLITEAIFSADGTTLAVSCEDGVIRFYQVYQHTNDSNPRCLHQWKPHGGKPVSSFFFLDNYTEESGDQTLWKHAITCADNNTEIKVWSCETWECTQTITFVPSIEQPLSFKAEIDPTSSYLVLADMTTRELYVLQVRKETFRVDNGTSITNGKAAEDSFNFSRNDGKTSENNSTVALNVSSTASTNSGSVITKAFVSSVAEFPLPSPILSFGILNAAVRKCKTSDAYLIEELDDYDEENSALYSVVIRMYLVQPKSVQECHLFYQPTVTLSTEVYSTLSSISGEYRNINQSSQSSGSTRMDDQLSMAAELANKTLGSGGGSEGDRENALNLSDIIKADKAPESGELNVVTTTVVAVATDTTSNGTIAVAVSATNSSGSVGSNSHQKHPINLMTPDSFSSTAEKTEKSKADDTVNPNVLSTLFMLANVTKQQQQQQQQQQQLKTSSDSPIGSYKDKHSPLNMLNIVNSTMIEEQEQAKVRNSGDLQQKPLLETPPVPPMPSAEMLASGGSSPSREVQEILSLKETDCMNEYYDSDNILLDETDGIGADEDELNDLENEINEDDDEDEGYNFKNIDDDDDDDVLQQRKVEVKPKDAQSVQSLKEVKPNNQEQILSHEKKVKSEPSNKIDWPKVPEVPHPPSGQPPPPAAPMIVTVPQHSKQLDDLSQKMDRLLDVVQEQSHQIAGLRSQINELNRARLEDAKTHYLEINKLKNLIPGVISETYKSGQNVTAMHLHRELKDTISRMPAIVVMQLIEHLRPNIARELQLQISSFMGTKMDGLIQVIKTEIGNKLISGDVMFRTSIEKMCRSPQVLDTFKSAIQSGVRQGLEQIYTESLRTIVLPQQEKVSQELFRQLSHTFSVGTKEYIQKLDQYLAQQKQTSDRTGEVVELVKKIPEQVNTNIDQQNKVNAIVLREDVNRDFKLLQQNLLKVVKENIRHEIEKGLEAQASSLEDSVLSAVRSQTQTPAPSTVDIHEHIQTLLASGQINQAYHKALLSNDLSLVEFTLEKSDYSAVFNPCPLEQTVLLSLIQQISADMTNHNELKHRYLSDAIVALNFKDPITKEHAPKVMRELMQNCQNYLSSNPGQSIMVTSIKFLITAIKAIASFKRFDVAENSPLHSNKPF